LFSKHHPVATRVYEDVPIAPAADTVVSMPTFSMVPVASPKKSTKAGVDRLWIAQATGFHLHARESSALVGDRDL
ncbi:hypothetical protein, partial [Alicyclobacillus acidiphilus]|uniref:hypothetical protein n=1 Tax=Alicyclobacillus acidiphilus TaxID=182455 RepID=UPI001C3F1B4F